MSYPDPPPPPHQYMSQPFHGGSWPPFLMENEQPDLMEQFNHPPYKRPRNSDNPSNLVPPPQPNPRVNPSNVPGSNGTGTGHIFYKTRICAKFTQGLCRNGDTCSFAHGAEDLREPPPNWKEYVREKEGRPGGGNISSSGGGIDDDQRLIHKMKICKRYYNGEECPYGDKCNFLHERRFPMRFEVKGPPGRRESSVISIGTDVPGRRESTVISIGTTGHHSISGSGDFDVNQSKTVFFKTKLCSKWEMGQCPYGDRCHYAHGVSDLKVPEACAEAEQGLNSVPVPANPVPLSVSSIAAPANLTTVANVGDDKKKLRWKPGKKINGIYGDWISDDVSPPRFSG